MGLYLIIIGRSTIMQESVDQKKPREESTIPGIQAVAQNIRFYTFMTLARSKTAEIFFLKLWLALDKGKTWQRHTNKQEIEWEVDINASANEQSYKDFHCIVPREKANPELSKEKLKFHAGFKAV